MKIKLVDAEKEVNRLKDLQNDLEKEILMMERKVWILEFSRLFVPSSRIADFFQISDAEKDRNASETRYSAIEQELQDKEAYIHRTQEMYRTLLEQKVIQKLEGMDVLSVFDYLIFVVASND